MAVGDVDWQRLANRDQPLAERRALLATMLERDEPRVDTLCATFVEVAVRTTDLYAALDEATVAALDHRGVPSLSPNAGAIGLTVRDRDDAWAQCQPIYETLALRSLRDPALARWSFEAVKLRLGRMAALIALRHANERMLADGIASLVEISAAPGGDLLLYDLVSNWRDPVWLLALLDAVAADERAADQLAHGLRDGHLYPVAMPTTEEQRRRLCALARTAPSGARAVALAALRANESSDELDEIVVAALADRSAHSRVAHNAAQIAISHGLASAPIRDAAMLALDRSREAPLVTLVRTCVATAAQPVAIAGRVASIVSGAIEIGPPFVIGELGTTAVYRSVSAARGAQLGEDEIAVIVVGDGVAAYHVAPVRLPARERGFAEFAPVHRRTVDVVGVVDGWLVLAVGRPYDQERHWGGDCYVLGCEPRSGRWVCFGKARDGEHPRLVVDRPLDAPVDERSLPSVCFGSAIVWIADGRLRCVPHTIEPVFAHQDRPLQDLQERGWAAMHAMRATHAAAYAPADEPLQTALEAAWPSYDRATCVQVQRRGSVVRVEMPDSQALVWLAGK